MRRLLAVGLALTVAAVPALAQPPVDRQDLATTIDPAALGVSTSRIMRRLAADSQARRQGASPLKLEYHVEVFGTAPSLRFFAGQDLVFGAVPGSAPTHRDMLDMFTPQEFKSPRVDLLGLAFGAAMVGAKKVQDWQYLRDLRNYQKLVEQGVNVSAPQPPRK